ncbi:MAG: hydantoinase/oxoprolinase family protein [Chloroflexota bacterium]|nr:hydantoinase/oxoprolinase family protein [Chloroflexota bacterium]
MQQRLVGVDVGGTFTDFLLLEGSTLKTHKVLSTPEDPSKAVILGLDELGVRNQIPVAHGSTVATNTLLERRGAKTALITTRGFEDILNIGRQARPSLYDLLQEKPEPLTSDALIFSAAERLDNHGKVVLPLTPHEAEAIIDQLRKSDVEAISVSLLFSFLNPLHEDYLGSLLAALPNKPFVSLSSRVLPEFREFERTSTVTVNAYVGPVMSRYLKHLEIGVGKEGLRIMQSSGGSISAQQALEQPVRTILSGPAGGVVGASWIAGQSGYPNIVTFDMGGTSTDVSLCPGEIQHTTTGVTGGFPVSVPMIDIQTVGAGGGSIAGIDSGGALRVGPRSAGADPGPSCYGKGTEPTVTDANLVLGRLVPQHFLDGRLPLDIERAKQAITPIAQALGSDLYSAALGIVRVVNASMERAVRSVSLERGYDPRDFTLFAFGGAGGMHACELAHELGIPRVLIPSYPGILSALGVAIADVVKDYARTVMLHFNHIEPSVIDEAFGPLERQAREDLAKEGYEEARWQLHRLLDVRYVGQSYELTVPMPEVHEGLLRDAAASAFNQVHMARFGHSDETQDIEIVNVRLKAIALTDKPESVRRNIDKDASPDAVSYVETKFSSGAFPETPVFARNTLIAGSQFPGPAIVVQMDATTVIPPGWTATTDAFGNLIAVLG